MTITCSAPSSSTFTIQTKAQTEGENWFDIPYDENRLVFGTACVERVYSLPPGTVVIQRRRETSLLSRYPLKTNNIRRHRKLKMSSELSYIDKKVVCEAVDFIALENKEVERFMKEFGEKGSLGLWMDAKGFRNSSDKGGVLSKMESYSVLHEQILACLQAVEGNDRNAYQLIIALYKKIEELEREADIHADGKSKALCILAKQFLANKWKLDHNVKRVECVVLTRELNKAREFADTLNQRLEKTIDSFNSLQKDNRILHEDNQKLHEGNQKLHEDNQKLHEGNQNLQKSVDDLHEENLELKNTMRKVLNENQSLKDMISDANERADQRLKEVVEENRRSMQKMLIEMREMNIESK